MHTNGGIFKRKEEGGDSSNAIVCCHEVIILWLIEKEKEKSCRVFVRMCRLVGERPAIDHVGGGIERHHRTREQGDLGASITLLDRNTNENQFDLNIQMGGRHHRAVVVRVNTHTTASKTDVALGAAGAVGTGSAGEGRTRDVDSDGHQLGIGRYRRSGHVGRAGRSTGRRRFLHPQAAHLHQKVAHQFRPGRMLDAGRWRRRGRLLDGRRETRIARQGGLDFVRRQGVGSAHLFAEQLSTRTERTEGLGPALILAGREVAVSVRAFARLGRKAKKPADFALDPPGAVSVEERRRECVDQNGYQRQVVGVRRETMGPAGPAVQGQQNVIGHPAADDENEDEDGDSGGPSLLPVQE